MQTVFISYDHDDSDVARRVYDTLLNRPDIEPWLDKRRLRIVRFDPELKRLIESSSYFLALISNAAVSGGGYVVTEWTHAIKQNRRIIPFLLDRSAEDKPETPEILKEFEQIHWVRAYESFDNAMRKVLREIYGDLAQGMFRETFSSLGSDNEGWRFDGWTLDDTDAGNQNSQSIMAKVAPSFYSQKQVCIAAIPVTLGNWSRIAYARKLTLHRAQIGASAQFEVTLSDGSHIVSIEDIALTGPQLDYRDADWQRVEQKFDAARFPTRNVTLNFKLSASDMIAMPLTKGEVNIDNIWID